MVGRVAQKAPARCNQSGRSYLSACSSFSHVSDSKVIVVVLIRVIKKGLKLTRPALEIGRYKMIKEHHTVGEVPPVKIR